MNSIELSSLFEQLLNKRVCVHTQTSIIEGVLKKMFVSNEYESIIIVESNNGILKINGSKIRTISEPTKIHKQNNN